MLDAMSEARIFSGLQVCKPGHSPSTRNPIAPDDLRVANPEPLHRNAALSYERGVAELRRALSPDVSRN
jgi:hypothetical protein